MLTFRCVLSYHNVDENDMKTNAFKFANEFVSMCFSTPNAYHYYQKGIDLKTFLKVDPNENK